MYRSRLGGDLPDAKILKYMSSVEADSTIIWYDIMGSQAHVLMLLKRELIRRPAARKILAALQSLKRKKDNLPGGPAEDIH